MRSVTSRRFRQIYAELPTDVRLHAKRAYRLFRDPSHPGLSFKKVDDEANLYSVRIGIGYRAVGKLDGDQIIWFWIGSHGDYDRLLRT